MELSLRTVLVVLGALVMLGILFDGFRRMQRSRREALSLDVKGDFKFPEANFSAELPNGGARVVGVRDAEELLEEAQIFRDQLDDFPGLSALEQLEEKAEHALAPGIKDSLHEERIYAGEPDFQHDSYDLSGENKAFTTNESEIENVLQSEPRETLATKSKLSEKQSLLSDALVPKAKPLNLDEHVPLLMDVEELGKELEPQNSREEAFSASETIELRVEDIPSIEASVSGISEILAPQLVEEPQIVEREEVEKVVIDDGRQEAAEMMAQAAYAPVKKPGPNAKRISERPDPSLVLVTHVIPHDEEGFCGEDILYLVNSCDLRHGEKEIFHRFEKENGEGHIQFSMANSFNPGIFNPETLLHERIYGVSLFMSLPGPNKAMDAFEAMTEMASVIARNLGGDVHDETHSIMALQTIEHNRQLVRDFVRKQKLAGKK
jgi:cell division protein ZipA